jgi:hypothetical protein
LAQNYADFSALSQATKVRAVKAAIVKYPKKEVDKNKAHVAAGNHQKKWEGKNKQKERPNVTIHCRILISDWYFARPSRSSSTVESISGCDLSGSGTVWVTGLDPLIRSYASIAGHRHAFLLGLRSQSTRAF